MKKQLRIGLDIDGVIANFTQATIERAKELGLSNQYIKSWEDVTYWDVSPIFSQIMKDAWLDPSFWLGLEPMPGCLPLPVKPCCYITARPIDSKVTKQWLKKHNFPNAKVISVKTPEEKLAHIKNEKLDVFVDDLFSTVKQLRDANINAVLYKAPYQVGHVEECKGLPTISTLSEITDIID
jgi:uncharacterized HAD superfamily protein